MKSAKWVADVKFIFVDECHCSVQWSTYFRPKYKEIEQLRAIFINTKIVGVTATASTNMQQEIMRILNLKSPIVISAHVDRANIRYFEKKRPTQTGRGRSNDQSFLNVFLPYIKEIKMKKKMSKNFDLLQSEVVWFWK